MTKKIEITNLTTNSVIDLRSIQNDDVISSLDINQINGKYLAVEPVNNRLIIYPQSPQLDTELPIILDTFGDAGLLNNPLDAKWDYVRQKIWIADTANHRILKSSSNHSNNVEVIVDDLIYYPHSVAININTGGCFVKGYDDLNMTICSVVRISSSGELLVKFTFSNIINVEGLSTSSSESGVEFLSSSSSEGDNISNIPLNQTIDYDYVRNRIWWINRASIYMADLKNSQVKKFNTGHPYVSTASIAIEKNTGNAFIVVRDVHNEDFVIQVFRDNNTILADSWIEGI